MEEKKDIIISNSNKYAEIKKLLVSKKYKEAENTVKNELSKNNRNIDAQLFVFLGHLAVTK